MTEIPQSIRNLGTNLVALGLSEWRTNGVRKGFALRWPTMRGQNYVIEGAVNPAGPWTAIATNGGNSYVQGITVTNLIGAQYYRVKAAH